MDEVEVVARELARWFGVDWQGRLVNEHLREQFRVRAREMIAVLDATRAAP